MKIGHIVQFVIIIVLIIALVVGNNIVLEPQMASNIDGLQAYFEEVLNFHPFPQSTDTINAARQGGQELSKQIIQEGSVLVKNNGVLPLDPSVHTEVNVFGHASIDWVYGGSGSGQVVPENNNASENIDFLKALDMYGIAYNDSLQAMYNKFAGPAGDIGSISTGYMQFYKLYEPSLENKDYYSDSLLIEAEAHNYRSLTYDVIMKNASNGCYRTFKHNGYFAHISSFTDYFKNSLDLTTNRGAFYSLLGIPERRIFTRVHNSAPVSYLSGSSVANSLIADDCVIEGRVENSILFRGVKIGRGTVVKNSILFGGTTVGRDCELNCVVTDKSVTISDFCRLSGHESLPFYIGKMRRV